MSWVGWTVWLHVVGAAVWVGGHLVLLLRYFPQAWQARNPALLLEFERRYEAIGLLALALQVVTGLLLLAHYRAWPFGPLDTPYGRLGLWKITGLTVTLLLALHARLRLLPRLSVQNLPLLALHVLFVTLIGLGLVWVGLAVRWGGL